MIVCECKFEPNNRTNYTYRKSTYTQIKSCKLNETYVLDYTNYNKTKAQKNHKMLDRIVPKGVHGYLFWETTEQNLNRHP